MEEPSGGHAAADADQVTRFTAETIAARQAPAGARILIALGVGCILFGGIFFAAKHSGHNVVATVTHEGPCSNGTCTVDVVYEVAGSQVAAVMYGVNSGEIYGPPSHRLLNINYDSGDEASLTTNDMPNAIWIGFGAAGLAFVGWGAWLWLRRMASPRQPAVAAAGGAPASAAVTATTAPAVADLPALSGPSRTSRRGPGWVADKSGTVAIVEGYPRWSAVIFTPLVAILPGLMLMQNSPTLKESPANPGLYPDPGGQPGLRHWDGRQWSPFLLQADPADGLPDGGKAPAEVWSPLAGSQPQGHDGADRIRRAGIMFAAWLGVTAVAAAVTVVLYARDLSKPQADFTLAVVALLAAVFAFLVTCSAWGRRKNLKKIDQAGRAAAAGAGGRAAVGPGDTGSQPADDGRQYRRTGLGGGHAPTSGGDRRLPPARQRHRR